VVGDQLVSPLVEIEDFIEIGDGQGLCMHLSRELNFVCDFNLLPSLGTTALETQISDLPTGQLFTFQAEDFVLQVQRTDFLEDEDAYYVWQTLDLSVAAIQFPMGGKYAGTQILPGDEAFFMPGELNQDLIEFFADENGYWEANFDPETKLVKLTLADDALSRVNEVFQSFCTKYADGIEVEDLLEVASLFKKSGQADDARQIQFLNPDSNSVESRTLNYPQVLGANCVLEQSGIEIVDAEGTDNFEASATIEVRLRGDVSRWAGRTRFGVSIYEWIPLEFLRSYSVDFILKTSTEESAVQVIQFMPSNDWASNLGVTDEAGR